MGLHPIALPPMFAKPHGEFVGFMGFSEMCVCGFVEPNGDRVFPVSVYCGFDNRRLGPGDVFAGRRAHII